MIDLAGRVNVLAGIYEHVLCRDYVYHGRLTRVRMGNPEIDREVVLLAAKLGGNHTFEQEKEGRLAIVEGVSVSSRLQMRITLKNSCDILVCTLNI